jgi:hypothetical protein
MAPGGDLRPALLPAAVAVALLAEVRVRMDGHLLPVNGGASTATLDATSVTTFFGKP